MEKFAEINVGKEKMKNQARGIGHLQKNITHSLKGYLT
jgi:hypothetical protein